MTTALVTGGAGFIGSHLVDALLDRGDDVVVLDDLSSGERARVNGGARLETVDITDAAALEAVVDDVAPDAVFHLAAQASVTASVADPRRDCLVNVDGTLNVLEAAQRHGAPVVFTSTGGAIYGDDAPRPTREDHTPAPRSPYGASKWAAEAYVRTWSLASGIPHAVCRLANVYGPRQRPHGEAGVVAIFSRLLWQGEAPVLYGNGEPTRDFVHVADVVAALIAASGRRGVFNVCTGREASVRGVFERLREEAGVPGTEPRLAPLREGELLYSCMDPAHTARALGWTASIGVDEGLAQTYAALVDEFAAATAA